MSWRWWVAALVFAGSLLALQHYAAHRKTCVAGLFGGKCYHDCETRCCP